MAKTIEDTYTIIKKLGRGSEGTAYAVEDKEGHKLVLKEYSEPGLRFRDNTIKYLKLDLKHPSLYDITVTKEFCIYPFEPLTDITEEDFKSGMVQICDLQIFLLSHNIVYWDLGVRSSNFMLYKGALRLVDYGGFLFLDDVQSYPQCWLTKVVSHNTFQHLHYAMRLITLAYIIKHGAGFRRGVFYYRELIKDPKRGKHTLQTIISEGLIKREVINAVMNCNLLSPKGWDAIKQIGKLV